MAKRSLEVAVSPAVIRWARETSGAAVEGTAKRLGVSAATIEQWESTETPIGLSQLRKLAEYFKRPLAAFLLPEPPSEPAPPTDFRLLPGQHGHFERRTRLAIRKAAWLRSLARELMPELQRGLAPRIGNADLQDDPEGIATKERQRLEVDVEEQINWPNQWHAFRSWRDAVEDRNLLVFQLSMSVEDVRGFSLSDDEPFAIVVSSSDAARARIFTLFHEYAHLLLRQPGICLPRATELENTVPEAAVERWCNRFSAALLVPSKELRSTLGLATKPDPGSQLRELLLSGSRAFKVSEQVVLRRLLDLGLISRSAFRREIQRLLDEEKRATRGGGVVAPAGRCIAQHGRLFTSLVLEAKGRNLITHADVADYLSLRLKYLPEVQSRLSGVAA